MLARPGRLRCVLLIILLAAAAACSAQPRQFPPPVFVDGLGMGASPLIGPWVFHAGDDPGWASPSFDDSNWEAMRGDLPWGQQGYARYTGYAWYRIHLYPGSVPESSPQFS